MNKITQNKLVKNNTNLVIFAFVTTVFFQITAYKFIWGIEWVSRALNIVALIIFSLYAVNTLSRFKFDRNVINFYIIPGLLVYIGFFINISIESILNINVINQYGLLIPWAIYIAIPGLVKFGKLDVSSLWRYFHYFMLATVSISIVEYYLLFSGLIVPRPIVTDGGPFLAGYFSMLYAIETGELHYRFYASFMEPGTLAMFLLPAMAYAFLNLKYFSLVTYAVAMYMSDSLGGFVGVAMLIPLLIYFRFRKSAVLALVLISLTLFIANIFFASNLLVLYENKGDSRIDREVSFLGMLENLPGLFLNYPFGLPLTESTEQSQKNAAYYGSNFTPGNAFNLGGVLSFLGYLAVLFISLWYAVASLFRKGLLLDQQAAVVSIIVLMPFIFQRTVVWDSSIFALMCAPFVIDYLRRAIK
jgi:hypothetical protein